jgi:quercetin dioxygenase-like cupin family protein
MNAWVKWDQIPWEEVNQNISRKVIIGNNLMMVLYQFQPFQEWPAEKHKAEQSGYIIKGKILLRLPDEQQEMLLGPGDGYLIESHKNHSWKVVDEEVVLIDFFSPPRQELMHQKYAPLADVS